MFIATTMTRLINEALSILYQMMTHRPDIILLIIIICIGIGGIIFGLELIVLFIRFIITKKTQK